MNVLDYYKYNGHSKYWVLISYFKVNFQAYFLENLTYIIINVRSVIIFIYFQEDSIEILNDGEDKTCPSLVHFVGVYSWEERLQSFFQY